jgi:small GTP-binding protein
VPLITPRPPLNLGILAHVDAGETSLTERLLHDHGAIEALGSVDGKDTRTDSGELERERGITIRSAVAAFAVDGLQINLADTPGHPDFIAEVERALSVLDAAVLVLSAVEGVQAQTRVLMRSLRRLGLPTLLFVNKIDRGSARPRELVADIRRRLVTGAVPLATVRDPGTDRARAVPLPVTMADVRLFAGEVHERRRVVLHRVLPGGGTAQFGGRIARLDVLYEPCRRTEIEIPADALSAVAGFLTGVGAVVAATLETRDGWLVTADVPAGAAHRLNASLPGLTSGEGVVYARRGGDRRVRGAVPRREADQPWGEPDA